MSGDNRHALVFGASGVSGWALVNQALTYPSKTTFERVTGVANRPLSIEDAHLPHDPRLQLISGVDLTGSVESVVSSLKQKVKGCETVSHVFFCAYKEVGDFQTLKTVNTDLLRVAIEAIDQVAGNLQAVILQTGGKGYGVEFSDKLTITPPLKEDLPRIPEPYCDNIFYYPQYDLLHEMSKKKAWAFSEIRPDVIVGFTPGSNFMNAAQGLAFFLTLYREVHGPGAAVPFLGTQKSWRCKHTDTSQDILAKMEIYAALDRKKFANGSSFNCADGEVVTWADKWAPICAYFGLVGKPPGPQPVAIEEFVRCEGKAWDKLEKEHGLKKGIFENYSWGFLYFITTVFDFDRQYDLSYAREFGFKETALTVEGYELAFDRMRAAKIIP